MNELSFYNGQLLLHRQGGRSTVDEPLLSGSVTYVQQNERCGKSNIRVTRNASVINYRYMAPLRYLEDALCSDLFCDESLLQGAAATRPS